MVHLHQEYQRNLKAFELWLEKEKEKLSCLPHLEGDAERHEVTLREIQVDFDHHHHHLYTLCIKK